MIFEPVTLTWKGKDYTVDPDRVMMLIAKIEDIITLSEIFAYQQKGAAPMGKIAMAYGVALRYAGCSVRDDEVYKGLFDKDGGSDTLGALTALLGMMIPPPELQSSTDEAEAGKSQAASS